MKHVQVSTLIKELKNIYWKMSLTKCANKSILKCAPLQMSILKFGQPKMCVIKSSEEQNSVIQCAQPKMSVLRFDQPIVTLLMYRETTRSLLKCEIPRTSMFKRSWIEKTMEKFVNSSFWLLLLIQYLTLCYNDMLLFLN